MSTHPDIYPRSKYVLVKIEKREMTAGGIVIASTARGYDVIVVVRKGAEVPDDISVGDIIQLYPGRHTLITFDENPEYALTDATDIICIDRRTPDQLLGKQERALVGLDGEALS